MREYGATASVDNDMAEPDCPTCPKPNRAINGGPCDPCSSQIYAEGARASDDETRSKGRAIRLAVFVTRDGDPCLMDSEGEGAVDVWDELDSPSEPGLWIWDGHARDESGVGEYFHEVYTFTAGEWARPDPLTLARIGAGLDPWEGA